MPPKSKAKGRNGFYYFMLDVRTEESERGHTIHTMEELTEFAGPLWRNLSSDEKEHYNRRAKDEKNKGATDMERKFNSLGVSFAATEANDREFVEQLKIMKATIKNLVQSSSTSGLIQKPFYLCHVNHYFQEDKNYMPAEISIAEFTIENGITNTLHYIIHPGQIPLGVRGTAQNWAEKTHGIRLVDRNGEIEREDNYVKIYSAIVNFLKRDMGISQGSMVLPIIYSMPDSLVNNTSLSAVKSSLSFLSACAHEKRDLFRVYPLPELFFNLRKKFEVQDSTLPTVAICEGEIEKDRFSHFPNLGCDYHEMKDLSVHCSLSIVKRWAYTICDHICEMAGIQVIPGQHVPLGTEVDWTPVTTKSWPMDPRTEIGYTEPPPKSALKFVDLSKLKELRIREKEAVEEELSEARSLPPPLKPVFGGGPPPPGLSDTDFPPIGGGRGGGRGLFPKVGSGIWPISGRGKLAK